MKLGRQTILYALLLLLAGWAGNGCKTPETSENESSRPWNAPRQWGTGLPGFDQQRR